jgi:hypothetical protein
MVGGGRGAFIGPAHRIAARLDDQYELLAGALSAAPDRARSSAEDIGIAGATLDSHTAGNVWTSLQG